MTDKSEKLGSSWLMGLGSLGPLANVTATGLIGLLLYILVNDFRQQVREDRMMFREELRELHKDTDRLEKALFTLQTILSDNTSAVWQLTGEMRRGKKP